ncbi:MAG: VTT domain-containing protein [Candidatus Zambryskibacteria bacterium]|nr:VTT domain-containing protein [Candidatus Zambryskibacteria bacterium]
MNYLIHFIQFAGFFGYIVLFLIIFFESFPPTFFLPGDSLLFVTGFLASQGYFNMSLLVGTLFLASIFGYMFSYAMGEKLRSFILRSNDKYWFKIKHLHYTEDFYKKYGDKTIIIGRFVPIVRSFSPTLAGAVEMSYKKFIRDTIIGGFLWTGGLTSIGFYLSNIIPNADKLLTPIVLAIIFVSLLPAIIEYIHKWKK